MVVNTQKVIRNMKVLLVVLLTVALAVGGAVALYIKDIHDNPAKTFGNENADFKVIDDTGVEHQYNKGVIAFLIVGLDSNTDRESRNQGFRSDVIMVCVIDTDKKQAALVSIPRDTKARVQVMNSKGQPTRMVTTKINAAYSYGYNSGLGHEKGYENTLKAVNDLFNSTGAQISPISHYIGADMDDFVHVANLIGGVDLELPQDVPGFGSKGQTIHLEGERALDYVRIRKGKGLTGMDTDRTERQRGFIKAVAMKMQKQGALETMPKIYDDCVNKGYIKTNLSVEQMYAIYSAIDGIDLETVTFAMMPGYINDREGAGYWHVNKSQFKTMILDLFYNAQQGDGIRTVRTTEGTPETIPANTKAVYTYTKKKTSSTTKKTTKKTTAKTKTTTKSTTAKKTEATAESSKKTNSTNAQTTSETQNNP